MIYTTIGISKTTKDLLELLKHEHKVRTYDELIVAMANKERGMLLGSIFGMAPNLAEFKRDKDEFERI
jgi:hypothetical protein